MSRTVTAQRRTVRVLALHGCVVALAGCSATHAVDPADAGVDACVVAPLERADILFVVDPSGYAIGLQHALAEQYDGMLRALLSGDIDGDGVRDAEPIRSIHAGVIISDLGTAAVMLGPGGHCYDSADGEDGVLRAVGGASFLELGPRDDVEAAGIALGEATLAGNDGCSIQQHFEAALKALSPATPRDDYMPPRFLSGDAQGDRANEGFLRAESVLAIVFVAHHDDESVRDPELYVEPSALYPESPFLRAWHHPELLHPIERYVNGFLELRRRPEDLVVGVLAGFPTLLGLATDGETLEAVRDHPYMELTFWDMSHLPNLVCTGALVPGAFPGQRYIDAAIELDRRGARVSAASLCDEASYPAVTDEVVRGIFAAAQPACR